MSEQFGRNEERIHRFRIECDADAIREWLLAEAFEAGAGGAEEKEVDGRFHADIYATPDRIEAVRAVLEGAGASNVLVGPVEILPPVNWSEAWKEGLTALVISERLVVRPPFIEYELAEGQREIVIDPGQAFGTGNHASTRLCLEWIDELLIAKGGREHFDRVLDVGTGSGVLCLAAVALGAKTALGFDLDPVATHAAEQAAKDNELVPVVRFFTGPIEAVSSTEPPYPLVVANLLKREMLPIASEIASRVADRGRLVLAGLLEEDLKEALERFAKEGLHEVGRKQSVDGIGVWMSPCLVRD